MKKLLAIFVLWTFAFTCIYAIKDSTRVDLPRLTKTDKTKIKKYDLFVDKNGDGIADDRQILTDKTSEGTYKSYRYYTYNRNSMSDNGKPGKNWIRNRMHRYQRGCNNPEDPGTGAPNGGSPGGHGGHGGGHNGGGH